MWYAVRGMWVVLRGRRYEIIIGNGEVPLSHCSNPTQGSLGLPRPRASPGPMIGERSGESDMRRHHWGSTLSKVNQRMKW